MPIKGDRRDHFEAETDLWEIVARIAAGRKEREIDPALAALRACVAEAEGDPTVHPVALQRLKAMLGFVDTMDGWYGQMLTVPRPQIAALVKARHEDRRAAAMRPGKMGGVGQSRGDGERPWRWQHEVPEHVRHEVRRGSTTLLGDLRFRALLRADDWNSLPHAVRRRFSKRLAGGGTVIYVGEIAREPADPGRLVCSRSLPRRSARRCRCDATPDVPSVVTVTEDRRPAGRSGPGSTRRRDGFPQIIHCASASPGRPASRSTSAAASAWR